MIRYLDRPAAWQWTFQDPATPIREGILDLYNMICTIIVVIITFVLWMLVRAIMMFNISNNKIRSNITHGLVIEIVWTIIPARILGFIAIPSFLLLYSMDEIINPAITLKAIGHQWYWSYELTDTESSDRRINFDSYMITEDSLKEGQLRLLEVDNGLILPILTHIRVLVTSADVLHCWAVPSLGVKIDAVPGRINQTSLFIKRPGVFHGQCSELCGVNHRFMPITIEGSDISTFFAWLASFTQ
jgi:cytochrome c oxidase subunit 2